MTRLGESAFISFVICWVMIDDIHSLLGTMFFDNSSWCVGVFISVISFISFFIICSSIDNELILTFINLSIFCVRRNVWRFYFSAYISIWICDIRNFMMLIKELAIARLAWTGVVVSMRLVFLGWTELISIWNPLI